MGAEHRYNIQALNALIDLLTVSQSTTAFLSAAWTTDIAVGATKLFSAETSNAGIDVSGVEGEVSISVELTLANAGFGAFVDVGLVVSRDGTTWDDHEYEEVNFEISGVSGKLTKVLNIGKCAKVKLWKVKNNDPTYAITSTQVFLSQKV